MLKKTKAAIVAELTKATVLTDPAPMPGGGLANIAKALADDIKGIKKKGNEKTM